MEASSDLLVCCCWWRSRQSCGHLISTLPVTLVQSIAESLTDTRIQWCDSFLLLSTLPVKFNATNLVVLPNGDLLLSDHSHDRVLLLPASASSWHGTASPIVCAYIATPRGLCVSTVACTPGDVVAAELTVLVAAEAESRVLRFVPDGSGDVLQAIGGDTLAAPHSIAISARDSTIWVTDSCLHCVFSFTPDGTSVLRRVGTKGSGPGHLLYPTGIAVTSDGHVVVCEDGNSRVQVLQPATGRHVCFLATFGYGEQQVSRPQSVALDCNGSVLVADMGNNRVVAVGLPPAWPAATCTGSDEELEADGVVASSGWREFGEEECSKFKTPVALAVLPGSGRVVVVVRDAIKVI